MTKQIVMICPNIFSLIVGGLYNLTANSGGLQNHRLDMFFNILGVGKFHVSL